MTIDAKHDNVKAATECLTSALHLVKHLPDDVAERTRQLRAAERMAEGAAIWLRVEIERPEKERREAVRARILEGGK